MRQIKFRIWDIRGKEMIYPDLYWFEEEGIRDVPADAYGYQVMQFTGLKDRLGKEIWEGDILRADWHDGRYPVHTIGPVKWDEENARWDLGEGGSPKVDAQYHFEVIGNIYENPELLKEAQ